MKRRTLLSLPVTAMAAPALAQGFPARPIRLVVPYPPGGGVDGQARGLARSLSAALGGATIIVENRAGGSTRIGTDEVRRAAPDGLTLLLMPAIAWVGFFHSRTFDTKVWEEMTPIAGTAETPYNFLAASRASGHDSWAKVVEAARRRPDGLRVAGPSAGGIIELSVNEILQGAGVNGIYAPFQGSAPAHAALLAGTVDVQILPFGDGLGQMRAGATFGLAMSGPARDPRAPEIPTFAELRIGSTLMNSFSIWGPANVPMPIVQRLAQAISEAARDAEFIAFMEDRQGFTVRVRDGAAVRQELVDFDRNWGPRLAASARG
ncbi:MAG: tripartite tricarboxylate transporter substrate binding protein [Roseomonas sp.]|nr:tripartite tricarboxylate transporter substrate binding protein [Roseomonas sp.]